MATLEDELKDLKEKNNELAQKVQYWKMTAAQRNDEKLTLMKEMNELRLKLTRLQNNGGIQARKLDAALQEASEKAISHLVKASAEIANSMEITKAYMRDRQELETHSPRWSAIGGTPNTDKVHRVPPMMMGGQSIQPVVALSRTLLNTSNPRVTSRSPSQNRSLTERAVPMHMLQDVYIPLTRIDTSDFPNVNLDIDTDTNNADDSVADLGLDEDEDDDDMTDDSDGHISEEHEYNTSKLPPVSEEEHETSVEIQPIRLRLHITPHFEIEDQQHRVRTKVRESQRVNRNRESQENNRDSQGDTDTQPSKNINDQGSKNRQSHDQNLNDQSDNNCDRNREGVNKVNNLPRLTPVTQRDTQGDSHRDNPLEGPSWLLDKVPPKSKGNTPKATSRVALEPDSTTEIGRIASDRNTPNTPCQTEEIPEVELVPEFSPTVRRRKRTSSPPLLATPRTHQYSPRPASSKRNSTTGRVLKVVVAKMRLDACGASPSPSSMCPTPCPPSPSPAPAPAAKRARDPSHSHMRTFDAPSPNGATDSRVIVSETRNLVEDEVDIEPEINMESSRDVQDRGRGHSREVNRSRSHQGQDNPRGRATSEHDQRGQYNDSRDSHHRNRLTNLERESGRSRVNSHDSRDSDSGSGGAGDCVTEGRTRRNRKAVTYKEKPLNRKLRR